MEKALQRLAEAEMTSKSLPSPSSSESSSKTDVENETNAEGFMRVQISVGDTPPATPTTSATSSSNYPNSAFKGIPKALLERVSN